MQIIKSLHAGVLHRNLNLHGQPLFCVSLLWGFRLDSGEPVLEQALWESIAAALGKNELFDAGLPKPRGEALVHGRFIAPGGEPVDAGHVRLCIAGIDKQLAVHGDRYWGGVLGPSKPEPFTEMPIDYARAFGGEGYPANPVGRGFGEVQDEGGGKRHPLPNIEYPRHTVGAPGDRPPPAGFGRIDLSWKPRSGRAGTYDQAYIEQRMPGYPDDLDTLFFNDAAADQWLDGYFHGDEAFELDNMNAERPRLAGRLPAVRARCLLRQRLGEQSLLHELTPALDTVWLFPNDNLGVLIHRATLRAGADDGTDIEQLLLAHENLADAPRERGHYEEQLRLRTDPEEAFKYSLDTAPLIPLGCRCGFKLIQERGDFPLENLGVRNMDAYAGAQQAQAEQIVAQRQAEYGEAANPTGVDPKAVAAAQPPSPEAARMQALIEDILPGAGGDPAALDLSKLNLKGFDALNAYAEEMAEDKRAQAERQLRAQLDELKARAPAPETLQAIAELERVLESLRLPPVLPRPEFAEHLAAAGEQLRQYERELAELRASGLVEPERLDQAEIDRDGLQRMLEEAEGQAKDGYRLGAHHLPAGRSPHPGQEAAIAAALLAAHRQGGATVGGDYAFVDLSGQDLAGADLSGAYLEYADLTGTRLAGANLSKAILAHARLIDTDLRGADLSGANLGAAHIENADFSDALTRGLLLGKARLIGARFHRCDLTGALDTFLETRFERADFRGALLSQQNFVEVDLSGCGFAEATLDGAAFLKTPLADTDFTGASLQGTNLVELGAERARFDGARMKNVRFVGGCTLSGARFRGAILDEANLRACDLAGADFSGASLLKTDCSESSLRGACLDGALARGAQFNKADLDGARLRGADLMEGSLYKARLVGADLREANLYSVNFLDSTLGETRFEGAYLEQTILKDWRPA